MSEEIFRGGGAHSCDYCDVISIKNLLGAWREFRMGKRSNTDVASFELHLEEYIFQMHEVFIGGTWKPDPYRVSIIEDPKRRTIHAASIRDRVLYQALYRKLYPIFDRQFIYDVYSSRNYKGTHAGVKRFAMFARKVSQNYTRTGYVLKCDVRKFFDSVDHGILFQLISKRISDERVLMLIYKIIDSFHHTHGKGLPLGNVTSQLFANIYMDEFDQFVKHKIKAKYYIRYCDDFVIVDESRETLLNHLDKIGPFLYENLSLDLHPRKVEVRELHRGVDFLGYVSLPHYAVLRTKTKKRMFRKLCNAKKQLDLDSEIISKAKFDNIVASYSGMLKHCKGRKILDAILRIVESGISIQQAI